jgi:RecB family exonuclease
MPLPNDFQFSQANLQDYVDCPRRFYLRYVRRLAWPALEAEPAIENERHRQQGEAFHRLVHQVLSGISPERLSRAISEENLVRWWHNYLEKGPADLPELRHPEIVLSAPLNDHRLVAKYDLIAVDPGQRAIILDWKTFRKQPQREWLAARLQTRVYPYLLVQAGSQLNGGQPLQPQQVDMVYWFANFPRDPERFAYDEAQCEADGGYLASLVEEIKSLGEADFLLTTQERRCRYCVYRSLCRRGVRASAFSEAEDEPGLADEFDIPLELEQIAEIEY